MNINNINISNRAAIGNYIDQILKNLHRQNCEKKLDEKQKQILINQSIAELNTVLKN